MGAGDWGRGSNRPPLGSYSGKSETKPGKFENIRANLKNFPQPAIMY